MTSVLEAAEALKLLLLENRETCRESEAREHETELDREQRVTPKNNRLDYLLRDLKYIEDGLKTIKESQLTPDTKTLSPEGVKDIIRIAEEHHQAQATRVISVLEECSEDHKKQRAQYLKARQRVREAKLTQ